ncbi:hypothetical protein [Nocardia bhagyanarayanae]|uniref:GAF domain-containing protein n=1 Tax=Nocardia bhagyanarayanae TaxID=1215925 RepID=A0A543EY57_9NOCA|nr:hypothetical protein [Nocardia bhagyanarayanae]TQM26494.1 hypothetical protein FB390_6692 [Nocardia bhagyanarayanae]
MLETSPCAEAGDALPAAQPPPQIRNLHTVARELAKALPHGVLVGLTVRVGADIAVRAWSSPRAKLAEEAQLISDAAPNRAALCEELAVTVADLDAETRWSDCRAQLRLLGVRSLHCRGVRAANDTAVALAVYAERPHVLDANLDPVVAAACREIVAMLDGR